jgi:hypothetical protein
MNFTRLPKAVPGLLPVAALAAKPFLRGSSSFFNSYSHPMCCLLGLRQKHALTHACAKRFFCFAPLSADVLRAVLSRSPSLSC